MFKRVLLAGLLLLAGTSICSAQGYSPQSYGVKVGAGQPASVKASNYEAMKRCLEAAMAAKSSVLLPAATIEIDVPNKGSAAVSTLKINRDLRVMGANRRLSKIKFGPESPTYDYSGFHLEAGTKVLFKDCILEGPADPGQRGKYNRLTYGILQSGISNTPSGAKVFNTYGELRLHNVDIAGEWYTSIRGSHGDVLLELLDCDITGYTQALGWFAQYNTGKKLHAKNTYFHDAGIVGTGHLVYLSPCVSFDIDNCRFGGNYRYAIHHYGSAAKLAPKYAILRNSVVENTCADGIETTNTGYTQVINTVFNNRNRGVILKGDTSIENCTFNSPTGVTTYDNHSGVQVSIRACKFNSAATGVVTSVWPNCVWKISDCEFLGRGAGSVGTGQGAPGSQVYIDRSRFSGSFKRGVRVAGGSYFVTGCKFSGSYADAAIMYDDASGNVSKVVIDNSTFENAGRSIWAAVGESGKITGGGNYFKENQPTTRGGMYHAIQLRKAASPEKLASASMLEPSFNYDSYRVTGTARIENIKLGGSDDITRMCGGKIVLAAEGGWSLGDTGNIRPLSTGARKVGEVVTLAHDPQTGYWIEIRE